VNGDECPSEVNTEKHFKSGNPKAVIVGQVGKMEIGTPNGFIQAISEGEGLYNSQLSTFMILSERMVKVVMMMLKEIMNVLVVMKLMLETVNKFCQKPNEVAGSGVMKYILEEKIRRKYVPGIKRTFPTK
jgi:hypothetical protein